MPGTGVYKPAEYAKRYAVWRQGRDPDRYYSISDVTRGLLDQIAKGEGTDDATAKAHGLASGYDVAFGHNAFGKQTKDLSKMTLDEVDAYQASMLADPRNNRHTSSAVGRYQIVRETLGALRRRMGLTGHEIFDADMQDRLAAALLDSRGINKFVAGTLGADDFQNQLAQEWASVADVKTGQSHWKQRTGTSTADIQAALRRLRMY